MTQDNLVDWLALHLLPGMGPVTKRQALDRFGNPGDVAFRVPVGQLRKLPRFRRDWVDEILDARKTLRRQAEQELRRCERLGVRPVPWVDDDYPAAFECLHDPPVLIYRRGELPPAVLRVAVIGSRRASRYGTRVATGLASGLAARGIEVVSGGARGIDTAGHRGALAESGRTVAILGSGLARPYPEENRGLFDEVAARGAVLSELALDEAPLAAHFPRRNRLVSALAAAVVVVEAGQRSGCHNTVAHALEQGRDVFAVPGPVTSPTSAGCNRLIQQGAKLVQNIEDILEELPPLFRAAAGPDPAEEVPVVLDDLPEDEAHLLGLLDPVEPVQLDELAQQALFGTGRLQAALFGLEVRGAVEQLPGGYYLLRPLEEPERDGAVPGHRRVAGQGEDDQQVPGA
jgi:DNA processing protein